MSTLITDKVDNAAVQKEKLDTSAYLPHTPWLQFLLVCCLFALWGMAGNLNDILIAQFKKGFDLTDTQTALVQSIFFLGYFFVALPAAALIKRFSYKAAIIIGLCLYALGCFLFVPAAQIMTYGAFLACLGVIACGLSFLETSANTYSSLLGPIQSSTQRINFSQIFNSLGVRATSRPAFFTMFFSKSTIRSPSPKDARTFRGTRSPLARRSTASTLAASAFRLKGLVT